MEVPVETFQLEQHRLGCRLVRAIVGLEKLETAQMDCQRLGAGLSAEVVTTMAPVRYIGRLMAVAMMIALESKRSASVQLVIVLVQREQSPF